jgi:hypothetical protein
MHMKTIVRALLGAIRPAALIAAVAVSASVLSALLPAQAAVRYQAHERGQVIQLVANQTSQAAVIHDPSKGPQPGDTFVSTDNLLSEGKQVGDDLVVCTEVATGKLLCTVDASLTGRGRIAQQGAFTPGAEVDTFAVTGGTGQFSAARGYAIFRPVSRTEADITIHLR